MGGEYTNNCSKYLSNVPDNVTAQIEQTINSTLLNFLPALCSYLRDKKQLEERSFEEEEFNRLCCSTFNASKNLTGGETNPETEVPYLLYVLILVLLSPIGITLNSLIMFTVYKVKRLRNTTGYFICNLALADILLILEMIIYIVLEQTGVLSSGPTTNYIFPSFDVFLGSASLLLVTAVSIERGIAVARPLKYPRYLSEKRAKLLILCIWIYCFLLFIFGVLRIYIGNHYYILLYFYTAVTFSFFIPCIFVVTSYNIIVFSALKTMKMEKKICRALVAISMMNNDTPTSGIDQTSAPVRQNRCREIKVALKVTTLTCPLVCGWGYFMVCNVYEKAADHAFIGVANFMITFIPFIVSCLDPITYILFTRTLRQGAWMIISRSHAGAKLYRLVCQRRESSQEPVIRQRLGARDRIQQLQFSAEHSKLLEMKNTQNTCI